MLWFVLGCGTGTAPPADAPPELAETASLPLGITVGDVGATGARLWTRADATTMVHWEVRGGDDTRRGAVIAGDHGVAVVPAEALQLTPATPYTVRMWAAAERGPAPPADAAQATFTTAPDPATTAPLRLAWSGDLGGQNVCRDAARGFPILDVVREAEPDLFVGVGDLIYADGTCTATGALGNAQVPLATGAATTVDEYLAHWWYVLEDPAFQRLRAEVPVVPIWDDHEIVNDSGPSSPGAERLPAAAEALRTAWPLADGPLYRTLRWGRHAELFVLDTRSHRAAHTDPDAGPEPKTMLGAPQRRWLIDGLKTSDATWKIVVSSVPLALPTGQKGARDGWADLGDGTGYERELAAILGAIRLEGVTGVVVLTADVHHAEAFRYQPFGDAPEVVVHELVAGPLSSGVFPGTGLDSSFHPTRLFVHEPDSPAAITTFDEALQWFNVGLLEIGADGHATARWLDGTGRVLGEVDLGTSGGTGD